MTISIPTESISEYSYRPGQPHFAPVQYFRELGCNWLRDLWRWSTLMLSGELNVADESVRLRAAAYRSQLVTI